KREDGARRRPAKPDNRAAAPAPDVSGAKQGRGGRGDKDKDKNKSLRKENKFTNDRANSRGKRGKQAEQPAMTKPVRKKEEKKVEKVREIQIPEKLTIRELAEKMKVQASAIVKKLFMEGLMVTVNQEIDFDKAEEIAMDYDIIAEHEEKVDVIAELLKDEEDNEEKLITRPPVVCVMGHVNHGKTSLLDAIRDTHVTDREAGGITQSIGAYVVEINGQKITFLDTPGHEAFTAMRMRGANSTDIAVLVVAADDGVMPQTVEAINHAKAAGVEIIVAINKIDKPNANVERVKQELSEYELIPEDWGGSTIFAPVSAKSQEGIDNLLEMILLTAEVLELKADPDRKARALVLEAKLDKGKGPVASVLVQKGTLRVGDYIACGAASGRVRAMMDENGHQVKAAGPSRPVEVQGLSEVPNAGEVLVVTDTDKEAKNIAATFVTESRNKLLEETRSRMSLDDLFSQIHEGDVKELNIVVKADVQGSVEAVRQSLEKLSNEEVAVKIVHGGVGAINESDVTLAAASNAIIIGFNVNPDATAKAIAQQEKIDVRLYKVIYKAIEDVEAAMKGMLAPLMEEKILGHAEIRQLFRASGVGTIAGSYVLDGTIERGCMVRIMRGNKKVFEGNLASLKRFKDDVKEVRSGFECGLVFEDFNDVEEFDKVEAYKMVEVPR
ncbi:MAG: translation initiation factor IF-2, partial [Eubacterium sp.]|nr:translation initiation factor IF-2 [Eubacterium sp.]